MFNNLITHVKKNQTKTQKHLIVVILCYIWFWLKYVEEYIYFPNTDNWQSNFVYENETRKHLESKVTDSR